MIGSQRHFNRIVFDDVEMKPIETLILGGSRTVIVCSRRMLRAERLGLCFYTASIVTSYHRSGEKFSSFETGVSSRSGALVEVFQPE